MTAYSAPCHCYIPMAGRGPCAAALFRSEHLSELFSDRMEYLSNRYFARLTEIKTDRPKRSVKTRSATLILAIQAISGISATKRMTPHRKASYFDFPKHNRPEQVSFGDATLSPGYQSPSRSYKVPYLAAAKPYGISPKVSFRFDSQRPSYPRT